MPIGLLLGSNGESIKHDKDSIESQLMSLEISLKPTIPTEATFDFKSKCDSTKKRIKNNIIKLQPIVQKEADFND